MIKTEFLTFDSTQPKVPGILSHNAKHVSVQKNEESWGIYKLFSKSLAYVFFCTAIFIYFFF